MINKGNKIKTFLFMNVGCILAAMGVYFFKIPNGFATGGVSGISTILAHLPKQLRKVQQTPTVDLCTETESHKVFSICKMLPEDFKIQAAMGKRRGCQQKGKN